MGTRADLRTIARSLGAGLLACGAFAASAGPAAARAVPVTPAGAGLTSPTGIAQTPDGALWVADDARGICRLDGGDPSAPVADAFCGDSHAGPVKATGLAFDPLSHSFYAGDGASSGGAVWRLRWDPETKAIAGGLPVVRLPLDRVTALTLVPASEPGTAADVLYASKESTAVTRISAATGAFPGVQAVAHAMQPGPTAIAHLDGRVYLAEGSDVTSAGLDGRHPAARVAGLAGGRPGALAADSARGRLYSGSANGLDDAVDVLDVATGALVTYERGFAGITGLGVEADGDLLVADDFGHAAGVIDAENHGRLWRVPLRSLQRPTVRVDASPAGVSASPDARFAYSSAPGSSFECRLDGAPWAPCPGMGEGESLLEGLTDGAHVFEVRAIDPDPEVGAGVPARRAFVVDTRAPRAWIVAPELPEVQEGRMARVELRSDEHGVDFECRLDGEPLPCESTTLVPAGALGEHELRVVATDPAGHTSDGDAERARWRYTTVARPAASEPVSGSSGSAPAGAPVTEAAAPSAPTVADAPAPVGDRLSRRPSRPGAVVLETRRIMRPRAGRPAPRIAVSFDAAPPAATARVVFEVDGRRIATRTFAVKSGRNRLVLRLSRTETRRLPRGVVRLVVSLVDASGRRGAGTPRRLRVS